MKKFFLLFFIITGTIYLYGSINSPKKEKASDNLLLKNIQLLDDQGATDKDEGLTPVCTGPKEHVFLSGYVCRCYKNYDTCRDNKGCK